MTKTTYKYDVPIDVRYIIEDKEHFNVEEALSLLLLHEQVFLNNNWWKEEWPKDAKDSFYIGVNCNDVFAWGCADSEELKFNDLKDLFEYWEKDNNWGPVIWCIIKRKEMPQRPVYKRIQEAGIWNLDDLQKQHGLEENKYDKILREFHD